MSAEQPASPVTDKGRRQLWQAYRLVALTVFNGVALFVLLNGAAWAYLRLLPSDPITLTFGSRPYALVYPGHTAEEVSELLRETWSRPVTWEPFTESRERRFVGRFVNVHPAGFRLSRGQAPWPPEPGRLNVFVFGGSTTFGYGVTDDETIVSFLQAFLDERMGRGRAACYNFGRGAYYSSTERVLLQELLAIDAVPAVAVFVDGLNDLAFDAPFPSDLLWRAVNRPLQNALAVLEDELPLTRLVARTKVARTPRPSEAELAAVFDDPGLLDARLARYVANRRMIRAIGAAWGVRLLFVWQPIPTYRYDLRYHLFGDSDFGINNFAAFGYVRMAERVHHDPPGSDFLWLADLQAGVREPLYVDRVHYTAAMSSLIATQIGRALLKPRSIASEPAPGSGGPATAR